MHYLVSKNVVLVQREIETPTIWILACGEAKLGCQGLDLRGGH